MALIKFEVTLKKDNINGGSIYRCQSLNIDGWSGGTLGQALDKCLERMHLAFDGMLTGNSSEKIRVMNSYGSVKLDVVFHAVKETPLSEFLDEGEKEENEDECPEPSPDQVSCSAEPAPVGASKKGKAKA